MGGPAAPPPRHAPPRIQERPTQRPAQAPAPESFWSWCLARAERRQRRLAWLLDGGPDPNPAIEARRQAALSGSGARAALGLERWHLAAVVIPQLRQAIRNDRCLPLGVGEGFGLVRAFEREIAAARGQPYRASLLRLAFALFDELDHLTGLAFVAEKPAPAPAQAPTT
jgi:hypothetical protein